MTALFIDSGMEASVRSGSGPPSRMDPKVLFESSLDTIERTIALVCRRSRLRGADAEDFASSVKLALLEDDCSILRKHSRISSLGAYLAVVIDRMLWDGRARTMGRFYASAEATRLGPAALMLELLVRRDQRPFEEALPIVRASFPAVARADAEEMMRRLPERAPRPRFVDIEDVDLPLAAPAGADQRAIELEQQQLSRRTAQLLRDTLASCSLEDRTMLRLHYGMELSLADVSRMMRLPQRPLYRQLERILARLRVALENAGIDARSIPDLLSGAFGDEFDLGLRDAEPRRQFEEGGEAP
jgi:RNA polymerase sigma factor (sigma-70 family)